jgi:hypothetical protein
MEGHLFWDKMYKYQASSGSEHKTYDCPTETQSETQQDETAKLYLRTKITNN